MSSSGSGFFHEYFADGFLGSCAGANSQIHRNFQRELSRKRIQSCPSPAIPEASRREEGGMEGKQSQSSEFIPKISSRAFPSSCRRSHSIIYFYLARKIQSSSRGTFPGKICPWNYFLGGILSVPALPRQIRAGAPDAPAWSCFQQHQPWDNSMGIIPS